MPTQISYLDAAERFGYIDKIKALLREKYPAGPTAYVRGYGCQQSVSDAERYRGLLAEMGYAAASAPETADLVLLNTCAVRENAEDRIYGNVGALSHAKKIRPGMVIVVAGCMTQQPAAAEKLKKSFPYVDIVAGSNAAGDLPRLLYEKLAFGRRGFAPAGPEVGREIYEDLPVRRAPGVAAFVPVMYGCDNFCSYCIVPYVRGRERSRDPLRVLDEVRSLVGEGRRDITLLGQNVNSYGKGLTPAVSFPELLRRVDALPGDFRVRFMTSHPKDCTPELLRAMADCPKVCRHLHLPVQSGSDRVLRQMNRHYTAEDYLRLLEQARALMPGLAVTSDVMVGFPGETREDFEATLALVERAGFASLYTFLYSPRVGTTAAALPDPVPAEEKSRWFRELLSVQEKQGRAWLERYVGSTLRVLVEAPAKAEGYLTSRAEDGSIVELPGGPELVGQFLMVRVASAHNTLLSGEITA